MPILILLAVIISGIFNASPGFISGQAKKAAGMQHPSIEIKESGITNSVKPDTTATTVILIS